MNFNLLDLYHLRSNKFFFYSKQLSRIKTILKFKMQNEFPKTILKLFQTREDESAPNTVHH